MNEEDILKLCNETAFSYRKCRKVLLENQGDYDAAYQQLEEMKQKRLEVAWDNFKAFFVGDQGVKLKMYDREHTMLSVPAIFPVLFMFIFRVPSWLIASIIVLLVLFSMDIKIESTVKRKRKGIQTVSVQDYKKNKNDTEIVTYDPKSGYYEYVVE